MASKGKRRTLSNGLTPKQEKFKQVVLQQIAEKGEINGTQAALEAYETTDKVTASTIAHENMNKPLISNDIEQALSANGISSDGILKNINGLAEAAPAKVTGETVLKANLAILKLLGHGDNGKKGKSSLTINNTMINIGYDEAKQKLQEVGKDADTFILEADTP